jgi:hypothetical protein
VNSPVGARPCSWKHSKYRPGTTFGNVKADVLEPFVPGFVRGDFVEVIQNSDWPE